MEEVVEKLRELLNNMKDWEKKPVLKSGKIVVELVKLPERRSKTRIKPEHLALMIRREDAFRGLLIVSPEELDDLRRALSREKLDSIVKGLWELYKEKNIEEYEL